MLFFILMTAAITTFVEVPSLMKKKHWKDVLVLSGFIFIGIALGIILVFKLPFPNPTKGLESLFRPVTKFIFGEG
jgi:uncharacterized membrane protein YfcA